MPSSVFMDQPLLLRQVLAEEFQHLRIELSMEGGAIEARRIINTLERQRLRFLIRTREKKVEMCGIGRTVEFRALGQVVFQGHDIFGSDTQATAFRAPQLNWGRYLLQTGLIREEADRISNYKGLDARVQSRIVLLGYVVIAYLSAHMPLLVAREWWRFKVGKRACQNKAGVAAA